MSRPFLTSSAGSTSPTTHERSSASAVSNIAERLDRWAELIAVGAASLPTDLPAAELQIVLAKVARLRRRRLVYLVARAIAHDIRGDGEP